MNFEFQPIGAERFTGEFGREDSLLGITHARRVGQKPVTLRVEVTDDVVMRSIGAHAAQCHRDKLGTGCLEALGHDGAGAVFAGAEKQAGAQGDAGDDEGRGFHAEFNH